MKSNPLSYQPPVIDLQVTNYIIYTSKMIVFTFVGYIPWREVCEDDIRLHDKARPVDQQSGL